LNNDCRILIQRKESQLMMLFRNENDRITFNDVITTFRKILFRQIKRRLGKQEWRIQQQILIDVSKQKFGEMKFKLTSWIVWFIISSFFQSWHHMKVSKEIRMEYENSSACWWRNKFDWKIIKSKISTRFRKQEYSARKKNMILRLQFLFLMNLRRRRIKANQSIINFNKWCICKRNEKIIISKYSRSRKFLCKMLNYFYWREKSFWELMER
jgi:hypothetical protein